MSEKIGKHLGLVALVTTFNEEDNIAGCLDSLLWCDSIIVVDSFSTDRTVEIIRSYEKVQLVQHEYYGAAAQKNRALANIDSNWVLILDADERCTDELRDEIIALLRSGPRHNAYGVKRQVYFLDRRLRFSGWQNDKVVRLIRPDRARYQERRVHAGVVVEGPIPDLRQPMIHHMAGSVREYAVRLTRYGWWGAAQCRRDGKRSGFLKVFSRPCWRFTRMYVIQLGFLDGLRGLVFCWLQSYATFLKWALVWSWQDGERRGVKPNLPKFEDD